MAHHSAQVLIDFAAALFRTAGVADGEAAQIASSLVESNLRGHDSHGIMRVVEYVGLLRRGDLVAGAEFRILSEAPSLLLADAGYGFGQVQCRRLVDRISIKAREQGVACGALRHCGHVGRLGEWVEQAAGHGLAALLSVNDNGAEVSVAPPGGTAARISTNPLALAVPTEGEPLVLDISTSAVAHGKVKVARLAGIPCPPGWIQDAHGRPTTDPEALETNPPGTLLPLGGDHAFKGFGLGVLLDILVAGLTGGFCPPAPTARPCNNVLLVAWDPERFAGHAHFVGEARKLIEFIRETPRKPGVTRIELPGDRSGRVRRERTQSGIPLPGGNWEKLVDLAGEMGVPVP
jgi:uncharacterized oxidoreductase